MTEEAQTRSLAQPEPADESPAVSARPVFISYRRADRELADRLYELLGERGVGAWYDPLIPLAKDWREAIVEAIGEARIVLILLSAQALLSDELRKELAVAAGANVPMLAVRLEDVAPTGSFAYELGRQNWFDVFGDPDARLIELADFLKVLAERPAEIPQKLQVFLQEHRRTRPGRLARLLRNNTLLVILFVAVSATLLLIYDQALSPRDALAAHGSFTAFLFVLAASTLGAPLLLFQALAYDGLGAVKPVLVLAAAVNTLLLILLTRNLGSWIIRRLSKQ